MDDLKGLLSALSPGYAKCRDCDQRVWWIKELNPKPDVKPKNSMLDVDGTPHWLTCTAQSAVEYRANREADRAAKGYSGASSGGRDAPTKCKTCDTMVMWKDAVLRLPAGGLPKPRPCRTSCLPPETDVVSGVRDPETLVLTH